MLPYNCTARFEIRPTAVTSTGVRVGEVLQVVEMRACFSRPKSFTPDPEINDIDRTNEWANLRVAKFPSEFRDGGDISVVIFPDGMDEGEYWDVDHVKQPVSVGGRVVSNKIVISRGVPGVD